MSHVHNMSTPINRAVTLAHTCCLCHQFACSADNTAGICTVPCSHRAIAVFLAALPLSRLVLSPPKALIPSHHLLVCCLLQEAAAAKSKAEERAALLFAKKKATASERKAKKEQKDEAERHMAAEEALVRRGWTHKGRKTGREWGLWGLMGMFLVKPAWPGCSGAC